MDAEELSLVYELVREHFEKTASRRAEAILDLWDVYRGQFWKVAPKQASIAAEARSSVPGLVETTASDTPTRQRANAPT
jgi:glutamate synthase domain-containing protein 3